MKRLFAFLLAILMVISLCACSDNKESDVTTNTADASSSGKGDGTTVIVRKDAPDPDILRAWKADKEDAPYIVFTDVSTVRIIRGAHTLESEVSYGEDGLGNKSIATDCGEFKGQSVYTIKDDVLTIIHPILDDNGQVTGYENLVYKVATDFTPLNIQPKEDFKADENLVGIWTNNLTGESYEFTNDGFFIMSVDNFNGNVETYIVNNTYTVDNGNITVYSVVDSDYNEVTNVIDYSIEGTKLILGGADYYLNGEGDPNSIESAE